MDASFCLDVCLNFRTAFIGKDFLVTDPGAIAVHYIQVCVKHYLIRGSNILQLT
jgi:hypothetical protein